MSKQVINLGTAPTGQGGDTPRSAGVKTIANFDELYEALGATGNPQTLPAAIPIAKGGTGGRTESEARAALGLTLVASKTDETAGRVVTPGYAGIGCAGGNNPPTLGSMSGLSLSGLFSFSAPTNSPAFSFGSALVSRHTDGSYGCLAMSIVDSRLAYRSYNYSTGFSTWATLWTTANTTVDSSGSIKRASPIARIADVGASTRADLLDGFQASGDWGVFNEKARGVEIVRLGIGRYRIVGALGLAHSGWQVGSPTDRNGGGKLGIATGALDEDGSVIIELRKIRYRLTDEGELEPVAGALMDVPAESWIDVRLDMPGIAADD